MTQDGDLTLKEALERLFPKGTLGKKSIKTCPKFPTSLFGAVGYLLEYSGAYHRVFPLGRNDSILSKKHKPLIKQFAQHGRDWHEITNAIRLDESEENIRRFAALNKKVQSHWKKLLQHGNQPATGIIKGESEWWFIASALLVFSDEACKHIGYKTNDDDKNFMDMVYISGMLSDENIETKTTHVDHKHLTAGGLNSYAPYLNGRLAKVLPKGRTPDVGCTFRAITHNLCLIRDNENLQVSWFSRKGVSQKSYDPLNILLVPFPFKISAKSFRKIGNPRHKKRATDNSGWYDVEQKWLEDTNVLDTLKPYLLNSDKMHGSVHSVVFPELSLDWESYQTIVEYILKFWNDGRDLDNAIQFLIAGVSGNHKGRKGNFAFVTTFHYDQKTKKWSAKSLGRQKHHRWKLNRSQLTDYALSSVLDSDISWWENIDVDQRAISVHLVRDNLAVCPLICEDLARSDPCHNPIRSIGPNLIVALLMDGPQIGSRWPGRYATNMADDPGSSVLSLSSLGLIERTNRTRRYPSNRCVALWKDDRATSISMELPEDSGAILLTLSATVATESTLDGRKNSDAISLQYQCHVPIRS